MLDEKQKKLFQSNNSICVVCPLLSFFSRQDPLLSFFFKNYVWNTNRHLFLACFKVSSFRLEQAVAGISVKIYNCKNIIEQAGNGPSRRHI